jgi:4-amino-4-deoxy-L-arabinose transferase-like glycosyltransferase
VDQESAGKERSGRSPLAQKKIDLCYWVGALILTLGVRIYLFGNYYTINNDGVSYIEAARHFWEGQWSEGLASFYPPLFPLMIAAAYPLFGDWEMAGQFLPFVLSLFILFPLFALLSRIYGQGVAHAALLFYAVSPFLARLSLEVRTELPYTFFLVLALYSLQRGLDHESLLYFFLVGTASALAYLIRPEGIGLIVVGPLFLFYRGWLLGRLKGNWLKAGVLALGFILFAAPYIFYLRWDTGNWLISRKTSTILSLGLAKHDPATQQVTVDEPASIIRLITSQPLVYGKKVLIDGFRSLGFYFLALHYSYLPLLALGWFFLFRERFWVREDFLLIVLIFFYLAAFSLLYVTRRYGIPLVPISLGWVGIGFMAMKEYFYSRWERREPLLTGLALFLFLAGTLPKTLQPIGRDKFYLREAGLYLKRKPGDAIVVTNNGRVAFYTERRNRIILREPPDVHSLLASPDGDYLALDKASFNHAKAAFEQHGWLFDKEFSNGDKESMFVFRRVAAP